MTREKRLMCPQCGSPLFYIVNYNGRELFFNVNYDHEIKPTKPQFEEVALLSPEVINCAGCSWKGSVRKLKKVFFG